MIKTIISTTSCTFNPSSWIKVINNKSNQIVEKFDLEPQVKKVMQISKKETVHFINDNDRDVTVDAILSDGVPGMSYITNN